MQTRTNKYGENAMMIDIYFLMLAIVIILLAIGYTTKQIYMLMLGYALLFLLAVSLMTVGIDFHSGINMTDVGATTVITDTYTTYTDSKIGLYLAVCSMVAFVVTVFQWRRLSGDE